MPPAFDQVDTGACEKLADSAGDEDLACTRRGLDPRGDVHRDPCDVRPAHLALANVDSGARLQVELRKVLADATSAHDRSRWRREHGEHTVAGVLDASAVVYRK